MYQLSQVLKSVAATFLTSLCLTLMLSGFLLLGWYMRGGRILSIQTGSMRPFLKPGDAVFVSPIKNDRLQVGDVVSYHSLHNPKLSVTHRVIAVTSSGKQVITKGDDLPEPDPPIPASAVIGQVQGFVPRLGRVVNLLHHPLWVVAGLYIVLAGLLLLELRHFVRQYHFRYRLF